MSIAFTMCRVANGISRVASAKIVLLQILMFCRELFASGGGGCGRAIKSSPVNYSPLSQVIEGHRLESSHAIIEHLHLLLVQYTALRGASSRVAS